MYELIFQGDVEFSGKFMPTVKAIIGNIDFPKEIQDNAGGGELDLQGYDLTVKPIQVGVRIRRSKYIRYDQFTQDDKERRIMSCDYYFLGYATRDESELYSYMVFDYKDYESKRDTPDIPCRDRRKNKKHSAVWFNCYANWDIRRHCETYICKGDIGKKPQMTKSPMGEIMSGRDVA
jgi:hypothetical protein